MIKEYPEDVWTKHIAFYFDGVSFVYKRHPKDQALAPRGRVWRRANEGLVRLYGEGTKMWHWRQASQA